MRRGHQDFFHQAGSYDALSKYGTDLVDYKTDTGVDAEALLDRYSAQLGIYREALSQALGMPVKETLLYSFFMNSTVKVGTV